MSANPWSLFVDLMFPLPFALLILLSLPIPKKFQQRIRGFVLWVCDTTLFLRIGSIPVIALATAVALLAFVLSASKWVQVSRAEAALDARDVLALEKARCLRWRHERNFWISLLSITVWIVLYRMYKVTKEVQALRNAQPTPGPNERPKRD